MREKDRSRVRHTVEIGQGERKKTWRKAERPGWCGHLSDTGSEVRNSLSADEHVMLISHLPLPAQLTSDHKDAHTHMEYYTYCMRVFLLTL